MSQMRYSTSPASARATSSGKLAIPTDSATSCEEAVTVSASTRAEGSEPSEVNRAGMDHLDGIGSPDSADGSRLPRHPCLTSYTKSPVGSRGRVEKTLENQTWRLVPS